MYRGHEDNGRDRILLELEDLCQRPYHGKLPVGTVGFRCDHGGKPVATEEERTCTLFFVWSEGHFLRKVEKGELKINRTIQKINNHQMNFKVWDPRSWTPVHLPPAQR